MNMNKINRKSFMPKTITLRLSDEDYQKFLNFARADNRPIANAIETLALRQLEEFIFVSAFEMDEILSDEGLKKRLKEGSKQAQKMKGRFVE
jgi:hypothetical protein